MRLGVLNAFAVSLSLFATGLVAGTPCKWTIARFSADFTLDRTFGGDLGYVASDAAGSYPRAVATTTAGDIITAGPIKIDGQDRFRIAKHFVGGLPDHSFGDDGVATTAFSYAAPSSGTIYGIQAPLDSFPTSVSIDGSGRIVVAGSAITSTGSSMIVLARYKPNGDLDLTFGKGGKVVTNIAAAAMEFARKAFHDKDGKILVAGYANFAPVLQPPQYMFAAIRYTAAGVLDATFGDGFYGPGVVLKQVYNRLADTATYDRATHTLVLAGGNGKRVYLLRLTGTGTRDTAWSFNGELVLYFDHADFIRVSGIAVDGSVVWMAGTGVSDHPASAYGWLRKYDTSTSEDRTPLLTVAEINALVATTPGKVAFVAEPLSQDRIWLHGSGYANSTDPLGGGEPFLTLRISGGRQWAHAMAVDGSGRIVVAGCSGYAL